jgi:hypothetical protein
VILFFAVVNNVSFLVKIQRELSSSLVESVDGSLIQGKNPMGGGGENQK